MELEVHPALLALRVFGEHRVGRVDDHDEVVLEVEDAHRLGHEAKGFAIMGAPSISIADEVKNTQPDLIVMRTHSRSGLSRFLLGSVSHSVVHNTNTSILLVR